MNRILFVLLFATTQPIFCGGVFSSLWQGQNQQDVLADNEQQIPHNFESSQNVSFACDPNNGSPRFKISYTYRLNGVATNAAFDWEDPQAQDNCNALERKLAQENDSARQKALQIALRFQRAFRGEYR